MSRLNRSNRHRRATHGARRKRTRTTTDAIEIIDHMIGNDRKLREMADQAVINAHIATLVYKARETARLTHSQLARMIRSRKSVIADVEDANFRGDALTILIRVANALQLEVQIRLGPTKRRRPAA